MEHWCSRCCKHIKPGQHYGGIVYIIEGKLLTFKTHIKDTECWTPPDTGEDGYGEKTTKGSRRLAA